MIIPKIGNDWDIILEKEFKSLYFQDLMLFLEREYKEQTIFPAKEDIFTALKLTPFNEVRVVIIGQDPYIKPNQAHGLAFSVKVGAGIPPSLRNIFKELESDCGCYYPDNGCLIPWAKQGVLLLNSVMTVRSGRSNSHRNIGWEMFTNAIIRELNKKGHIVYMLWGNYAKIKGELIDAENNLILKAAHPSPLAGGLFNGCKHFSKANMFLYETSPTTIDWQIPNVFSNTKE